MNARATPTADEPDGRVETYERTNSDGQPESVFYNPDETHEWVNAAQSGVVELEDWR